MTYFACQFKEQGGYKLSTLKIVPGVNVHILEPLQWRITDIKQDEFEGINTMWSKRCKPQSNWTIEEWMICLNRCIKQYRKQRTVKKQSIKKQTVKKSPLVKEVEVITPIEIIKPINPDQVKIIKPINSDQVKDQVDIIKPINPDQVEIIKPINPDQVKDQVNSDQVEIIKPINFVPNEDNKQIQINPINSAKPIQIKRPRVISRIQNGAIYDLITDDSNPIKQITDTIKEDIKYFIAKRLNELQADHGLNLECLIDFKLDLYFE